MSARGRAANDLRLGLKLSRPKRNDFRLISVFRFFSENRSPLFGIML